MNDQADTDRTAALLRAALTAAADVMVIPDAPERSHENQNNAKSPKSLRTPSSHKRTSHIWAPLAAAVGVLAIAAGSVIGAHLTSSSDPRPAQSQSQAQEATGTAARPPRPEFYLTATHPFAQDVVQFQVRRTNGGAVTGERTIPTANVGWGGYLAAAPGDRTFYFAQYTCTAAPSHTTFDRITITSAGRIMSFGPAGPPVPGLVIALAVSPGGSQVAYNALPGNCHGGGVTSPSVGWVRVEDLSTGAVRTWQDTPAQGQVGRLSWSPDGRAVIVDEAPLDRRLMELTVFALDPSDSSGGSLQAHSTTLLRQNSKCSTCMETALAGPNGSLIELESQGTGQQTRVKVVSVPIKAGSPATVLYTGPGGAPGDAVSNTDLLTDASGNWPLLWPARNRAFVQAGWIANGRLHPLPGVAQVFPQGVAW